MIKFSSVNLNSYYNSNKNMQWVENLHKKCYN